METLGVDSQFWRGKRVFLTGHTGIKGGWLSLWLGTMGAKVHGYALEPPSEPNFFSNASVAKVLCSDTRADLLDLPALSSALEVASPEIVIHMAAQAIVRESYIDPVGTYATNVMGTVHMLEAVCNVPSVQVVLIVTSDKCYENREWVWGYRENESIGGHDPYSSSKGCAELVVSAYYRSFLKEKGVGVATARAGNVIGGGDWATDRLVPDAIRSFIANEALVLRNPGAVRPWQHVLEPLAGYLILCQRIADNPEPFSGPWNFGPGEESIQSVSRLADILVKQWGAAARWELEKNSQPHEAVMLKLDCSKAKYKLQWNPVWSLEDGLAEVVNWYKAWLQEDDMYSFSINQINEYYREHVQA